MNILGISAFQHDSSACLIKDGQLIAAVEEERFTRIKHDNSFPYQGIDYCLKEGRISINEVDHVAFFWNPWIDSHRRLGYFLSRLPRSINFLTGQTGAYVGAWLPMIRPKKYLSKINGYQDRKTRFKFHYVEHHLAHAASAFYVSPFKEAAILTIDGLGEWASTMMAVGEDRCINKIKEIYFPDSMGAFYTTITTYLNFRRNSDEYKVMGLASYGKPSYYDQFRKAVLIEPDGVYRINPDYFDYVYGKDPFYSKKFIAEFGPARQKGEKITDRHADIAASAQKILEDVLLNIVDFLHQQSGKQALCISGGVGLNSVANGKILKNSKFKDIYIQPAAHDSGAALGAAYYIYNKLLGNERNFVMNHAYNGPSYTDQEIESDLELCKLPYEKCGNIAARTAELLAQGKIIGWFQGRMEFGPRALGSRSILADSRKAGMKDTINKYVKHREEFRPFAPAILAEHCGEYYESGHPSPFMLLVYDTREDKKTVIPAVTHIDGTGRVQTVDEKSNPVYRKLIEEFYRLTNVPVILNTSFNVMGEPIVNRPIEAIRCFYSTGIDYLAIGNFLVKKSEQ